MKKEIEITTDGRYELKIFSGMFEIDEPIYTIVSSSIEKIREIAKDSLNGTLHGNLAQLWHDHSLIAERRLTTDFIMDISYLW